MINFQNPYGILNISASQTILNRERLSFINIKKEISRKIRNSKSSLALGSVKDNDFLERIDPVDQDSYEILYQKMQEYESLNCHS